MKRQNVTFNCILQDVLKQPVTSCLTAVNPQEKQTENVGIWDRPQRHTPKTYHYTMDPSTYMARLSLYKVYLKYKNYMNNV